MNTPRKKIILLVLAVFGLLLLALVYLAVTRSLSLERGAMNLIESVQLPDSGEDARSFVDIQSESISMPLSCFSYREVASHGGEYKCVKGKVFSVFVSERENAILNFCGQEDKENCLFYAVIFQSDIRKFSNPKQYEGKNVEIRGLIRTYQGTASMTITEPVQIEIK